jgi:hypothetical protein
MEKEFVPYAPSLRMKALGFDEPCLGYYDGNNNLQYMFNGYPESFSKRMMGVSDSVWVGWISAPTFSQAFRWFREKQAIEGFIHKAIEGTYYFVIKRLGNNESNIYEFITNAPKNVDTYEEAELACLKKLIEIVEQKNEK